MRNHDDITEADITESVDRKFYLSREASAFEVYDDVPEHRQEQEV